MVSQQKGMGAIPFIGGVAFRVWAPFASKIYVSGTFNNWSMTKHPLDSEGNGYWSGDIAEAKSQDEYRYVIASPYLSEVQWRTDPYCKHVEDNTTDNGVIVSSDFIWQPESFSMPGWNELVIYELHVASFNRSTQEPGDFETVIQKLGYLKDLGINAIEIMPIFGFPGKFSLGYNPALPFDIKSSYGSPNEFKKFVEQAHEYGIAIILDVVYNHFGPSDLDTSLWRFDGWSENGRGGIYFYNNFRYKTIFGDRPDFGRGEVRQFIRDNVLMWIEEYRIDGLRFDSTVNIRNLYGNNNDPPNDIPEGWSLMQWLNNEVNSRMPWKITIAEDLQNNDYITHRTDNGGAGFDTQWGSFFYYSLLNTVVASTDSERNMYSLRDAIYQRFETNALKRVIYSENHDEVASINNKVRLPEAIWRGHAGSWFARKRSTLAATIVFTSPGIPMIFQGQEFLEWGSWSDSSSLDWSKKERFKGIWDLYQSLIRLRRNWFNNTKGLKGPNVNVYHINNNEKLIAFHRWDQGGPGDDVIVIVNIADRSYDSYTLGFPRSGNWYVRFNSDWQGYSSDFGNHPGYDTTAGSFGTGDNMPFIGNIGIGPYSALILSQ